MKSRIILLVLIITSFIFAGCNPYSGYTVDEVAKFSLAATASMIDNPGTVNPDGSITFSSKYTYSTMRRILKEADVNNDKVITRDEADSYSISISNAFRN